MSVDIDYIGICSNISIDLAHEVLHHYKYGKPIINNELLGYMTISTDSSSGKIKLGDCVIYCKKSFQVIENMEYKMKYGMSNYNEIKCIEKYGHLTKLDIGCAKYESYLKAIHYQNANTNIEYSDMSDIFSSVDNKDMFIEELNQIFTAMRDVDGIYYKNIQESNIIKVNESRAI